MAKKRAEKKATKAPKPGKKAARAQPLPGMEDARIPALEAVASDYADIRDQRIELNSQEAKLKIKALGLMKEHGKALYKRNGIEIRIIAGEDDLKVKVKHESDDSASID